MAISLYSTVRGFSRIAGFILACAVVAGLLGACSAPQPYVYDAAAYNRDDPNFAKMPKTRNAVTVCYSKYGAKQADVARLAAETCGYYGAGISFIRNTYTLCPMATPVGAEFACVGAKGTVTSKSGAAVTGQGTAWSGTPGQPGAPLSGFADGMRPMGMLFGRPASDPGAPEAKQ